MNNRKLHLYSIMPLDIDHVDEICEDIRAQYESGVASCALFSMTLVPEGNPPADKVGQMCAKYDIFKEKLTSMGISSGVLVQATIGHGWTLGQMFPYQQYTNFNDEETRSVVCPMDEGFHDYIRHIFSTIASHAPDCIMVDDDFRLVGRPGRGCGCPLHMAEFNKRAGTQLTRAELWSLIGANVQSDEAQRCAEIMADVQSDSLLETAKIMREGIDSVDPTIPGSFCCVGTDTRYVTEMVRIIAGKGNPTVVRINNGRYTAPGPRNLTNAFLRAAQQIAKFEGKTDVILAETDTCPQNRYSTGAMQLHSHFTGSILEGARGAKHWITRLAAHEPESGKAYRRVLGKHRGFYEAMADIVPDLKWRGCRIPVTSAPQASYGRDTYTAENGWCSCVLERFGLPMYFSAKNGGVVCLNSNLDKMFTDEEIKGILSGPVFLASDTAKRLIDRGFGEYLGVDVRPWSGLTPSGERLYVNGNRTNAQVGRQELVPLSDDVIVDSMVYNTVDRSNFTDLFPGTTIYKNSLGGTIFTFCGTPLANYDLTQAFAFLNYSRKQQLIKMLAMADELPVYYPGDEEVYFRAADMADGGLFCAVFNIGCDPIEDMQLVCSRKAAKIERLMPDGSRKAVAFKQDGDVLTLDYECRTLDPAILFIY